MALYSKETANFVKEELKSDSIIYRRFWEKLYYPGNKVEVSGIYICTVCGKEITSNEGDPFPPQNHHQHKPQKDIEWKLIVRTNTKGK